MNSYNLSTYNNELVREVFGAFSLEKKRFESSGIKNSGVPRFVAESLLDKIAPGSGELTETELDKINRFIKNAFPRKDDRQEILYRLNQGEIKKIIALMQVRVKVEKNSIIQEAIAKIPILNLEECEITTEVIDQNPMLLRQGVWGIITLAKKQDGKVEIIQFEPYQSEPINFSLYEQYRQQFNLEQWKDLLLCSMGFNPQHPNYTPTAKTWMLARLLPIVERNYHILELAPKGTGKSFVFENINSKVTVISGGKITPAQLFVNGRTQEIGLLGRHDVVVLDEVQSLTFDNPNEVIGTLKTYLANGRYNRSGYADISSDCSLVMLANIELTADLKPKHQANLIANLPLFFKETAFLDRFAGIIPGWEIPKFKMDMSASQVGLKMDFLGEVLLGLRQDNRFYCYAKNYTKFNSSNGTVRNENAILKSAAGFLKILYPHLQLTETEFQRDCLEPAFKLRQFIHTSLCYLDDEYKKTGDFMGIEINS